MVGHDTECEENCLEHGSLDFPKRIADELSFFLIIDFEWTN